METDETRGLCTSPPRSPPTRWILQGPPRARGRQFEAGLDQRRRRLSPRHLGGAAQASGRWAAVICIIPGVPGNTPELSAARPRQIGPRGRQTARGDGDLRRRTRTHPGSCRTDRCDGDPLASPLWVSAARDEKQR
ncbi:hypothetical protein GN956_G19589 [Arapaima gigas]